MPILISYTTTSNVMMLIPAVVSASNITSAQISHFIAAAEAEINAKMGKLYTVPMSGNGMLERIATELAAEKVLGQRVFTMQQENASEWPAAFGKDARDLLDMLAKGEAALIDNSGAVIAVNQTNAPVWSNTSGYLPTMTEDLTANMVDDPDKIDDIRADRARS